MAKQNYKWVVYFISITIITTIAVQVYWNYREYQINKQNLISKVQLSLDNSVEKYYANLTKSGIITFTSLDSINLKEKTDTIFLKTNSRYGFRKKIDSTLHNLVKNDNSKPILIKNNRNNSYPFFTPDKHFPKNIDSLISKVYISISRDTLDLFKLNSYLSEEFNRNNLDITYGLKYSYRHRSFNDSIATKTKEINLTNFPKNHLTAISNSTFLPHRSHLELLFTNETAILLRNSFISILLSFLLSISIIASLIYLLKTIYKQKQLADIKNDLISNITHELKTPIATISTALEAMVNFNALDDKIKSEKYISIANTQVVKLNIMVEKILETAILNQDDLPLNKQAINLNVLLKNVIEKYELINAEKTFTFKSNHQNIILNIDPFHFENAIGNIIDNAIKYGGNIISIELNSTKNNIEIFIKDNGNGIPKKYKDLIFEQFYRIPTGNTHNIKGFGIGLFYTKSIIEKHHGTIQLIHNKNNTTLFKIEFKNE
jgi:two-component system phosphate regulon sensor histidine kinase PhoR